MGKYQYKDLVDESVKIEGQQVIINDISGKYPRRVESFHGLDENFQKLTNDQIEQKKSGRNFNMQIQKQVITTTKYQQGYEQINQYQYEHEIEQESSMNNNNEPEDGQEPEQEEQENMDVPEDKDHVPESRQEHIEHSQEIDNNEQEMEEQENIKRNEQYIYLKQKEEKVDGKPKDEHEPEDEVKDTNQKRKKVLKKILLKFI